MFTTDVDDYPLMDIREISLGEGESDGDGDGDGGTTPAVGNG
jgi:hypothetical protein